MTHNNQLHVDPTTIRDPSLAPYIAASAIGKLTGSGRYGDDDEVLSTDTAEALREAAKKCADTYDEEDPRSGKTPVAPMGILAIHLLNLKNFDHSALDEDLSDPDIRFQLLISVGDIYKETGLKKGTHKHVREKDKFVNVLTGVAVDEIKHFSLTVPQQLSDPKNVLRLELYSTVVNADASNEPQIIGMVEVHLHELIQAMMVIDVVPLSLNHQRVASLYLEFAFMYGALGFHYSTQLANPGFNASRDLSRTMFPRVALPEDRDGEALLPVPQRPPSFIPWTCPAVTHWDEAVRRNPAGPAATAPVAFGDRVRGEMRRILRDYVPLRSRGDRLAFLRKLVRGSPGPRQSADAVGSRGGRDTGPPSGPARRLADQTRPGPDQRRTGPPGPGSGQDRNDRRPPAGASDQTAQLRQNSDSTPAPMPALVRKAAGAGAGAGAGAAAAAAAAGAPGPGPGPEPGSGLTSAGLSSPRGSPSSSSPTGQQPQRDSRPSQSTDTELPARGPQRAGSSTAKIAAPKQIRRAPLRRPAGDPSPSAAKTEDNSPGNSIDASVEIQ